MTHKGTVTLETERLILRRFTLEDYHDLYEYLSDEETVKYEPYAPITLEQSKEWAASRAASDAFFAVCLCESGKVIGNLFVQTQEQQALEIGYVFGRSYWHNGYATEALKAAIQYAFETEKVHRIHAQCSPDNVASWKLLERVGFRREGFLESNIYFNTDTNGNPIWQDTYIYAILAEDYFGNKKTNADFWSALQSLVSSSEIIIDRPKGTKHPRFDFMYPLDYGYLKDTTSPDGGGIDVWRGSLGGNMCDAIICTVDLLKKDSEIKILLGCTEAEKDTILRFHNDSKFMKGVMIRRAVK